jgi:dipeptidyl aminopeptidase/acylaminoacyl peptidase
MIRALQRVAPNRWWLCLFMGAGGIDLAGAQPPPASAFAALPEFSSVDISPDGLLIAWADRRGPREVAVIYDLETQSVRQQADFDATTKLRAIRWADDDTVLVDYSSTGKDVPGAPRFEFYRTIAVDVRDGSRRILLMTGGQRVTVTTSVIVALHPSKPKTVVMWSRDFSAVAERRQMDTLIPNRREDSGWVSVLFEVDTSTGRGTPIDKGDQFTGEWVVDRDGNSVARSDWKPLVNRYRILARRSYGGWREVYQRTDGRQLELQGLTADSQAIVAVGPNRSGRSVAWEIPRSGSAAKIFYQDAASDVESVMHDPFTGAPVGVRLGGLDQGVHWLDAEAQARFDAVAPAFKDRRVDIVGRSQDGKRVIARVNSQAHPAIYYIVDFATNKADIVGEEYPKLADVKLGEVRSITYRSRDGAAIPAYLTLPPEGGTTALPLVVLPHGGPETRDNNEFDWWSQFLASRGYAVLRPQFRGSKGFGDAFRRAGFRQWGRRMQDDLTDGVLAMIQQGVADPRRVCIVGGSYGGYAALAGAAFTPDLYKCAVSVNGVSDLPEMLGTVKVQNGAESDSVAYWRDNIGSPFDKWVIERSPARAADAIRVPILLMHGVDDTVVPIGQSESMARALEMRNKPFEFIRLSGEDHWLSRADTRLRVLTEIERFLREHL